MMLDFSAYALFLYVLAITVGKVFGMVVKNIQVLFWE